MMNSTEEIRCFSQRNKKDNIQMFHMIHTILMLPIHQISMSNRQEQWKQFSQQIIYLLQLIGFKLSNRNVQHVKFLSDNKESVDHAGHTGQLLLWSSTTG